jgi:hypothetical protein
MDLSQLAEWLLLAILGAVIAQSISGFIGRANRREEQRREWVGEINKVLLAIAKLEVTYRFLARRGGKIFRDEKGELLKDEFENYVTEEYEFNPDPRILPALKNLFGTDVVEEIAAQQVVEIRFLLEEKRNIAGNIDPTGDLMKQLYMLNIQTDLLVRFWIEKKDFDLFIHRLHEAHVSRIALHEKLNKYQSRSDALSIIRDILGRPAKWD